MNEDGEPIMDGAAWRFEQQLDMDSRDDYMADTFYDSDGEPDCTDDPEDDCHDGWSWTSAGTAECDWCGLELPQHEQDGAPCCSDPGCGGSPCTFPGYAANH